MSTPGQVPTGIDDDSTPEDAPIGDEVKDDSVQDRQDASVDPSSGTIDASPEGGGEDNIKPGEDLEPKEELPPIDLPDATTFNFTSTDEYSVASLQATAELSNPSKYSEAAKDVNHNNWNLATNDDLNQILNDCNKIGLPVDDPVYQETFARLSSALDPSLNPYLASEDPEVNTLFLNPGANLDKIALLTDEFDGQSYVDAFKFILHIQTMLDNANPPSDVTGTGTDTASTATDQGSETKEEEKKDDKFSKAAQDLKDKVESGEIEGGPMVEFMIYLFEFLGEYWEFFEDFDSAFADDEKKDDGTDKGSEAAPGFDELFSESDGTEQIDETKLAASSSAYLLQTYNYNGFRINKDPTQYQSHTDLENLIRTNYKDYFSEYKVTEFSKLKTEDANFEGSIVIFTDPEYPNYTFSGQVMENGDIQYWNPKNGQMETKSLSTLEDANFVSIFSPNDNLSTTIEAKADPEAIKLTTEKDKYVGARDAAKTEMEAAQKNADDVKVKFEGKQARLDELGAKTDRTASEDAEFKALETEFAELMKEEEAANAALKEATTSYESTNKNLHKFYHQNYTDLIDKKVLTQAQLDDEMEEIYSQILELEAKNSFEAMFDLDLAKLESGDITVVDMIKGFDDAKLENNFTKVDNFNTWKEGVKAGTMDGSISILAHEEGENSYLTIALVVDQNLYVAKIMKQGDETTKTITPYNINVEPFPLEELDFKGSMVPQPEILDKMKENRTNDPYAYLNEAIE
ncbi:hypothetical protein ACFL21_02500 [Patescibacteria group bacterium]